MKNLVLTGLRKTAINLPNLLVQMMTEQRIGRDSKETLLKVIKNRKLWTAVISYVLAGNDTKKEENEKLDKYLELAIVLGTFGITPMHLVKLL